MTRLFLPLFLLAMPAWAGERYESVDPKKVWDGDTFYVSIRLLGVDTPETGSRAGCPEEAALAERAHEMTADLLRHGKVTLDVEGVDRFGRLLARVTLPDGTRLGERLKAEGLARDWPLERSWCPE